MSELRWGHVLAVVLGCELIGAIWVPLPLVSRITFTVGTAIVIAIQVVAWWRDE